MRITEGLCNECSTDELVMEFIVVDEDCLDIEERFNLCPLCLETALNELKGYREAK